MPGFHASNVVLGAHMATVKRKYYLHLWGPPSQDYTIQWAQVNKTTNMASATAVSPDGFQAAFEHWSPVLVYGGVLPEGGQTAICPRHQADGIYPPHGMAEQWLQEWGWGRHAEVLTGILLGRARSWGHPLLFRETSL